MMVTVGVEAHIYRKNFHFKPCTHVERDVKMSWNLGMKMDSGWTWRRKYFISQSSTCSTFTETFTSLVHVREYSVMPIEKNDNILLQNSDKNEPFSHFHSIKINFTRVDEFESLSWKSWCACRITSTLHARFHTTFTNNFQLVRASSILSHSVVYIFLWKISGWLLHGPVCLAIFWTNFVSAVCFIHSQICQVITYELQTVQTMVQTYRRTRVNVIFTRFICRKPIWIQNWMQIGKICCILYWIVVFEKWR